MRIRRLWLVPGMLLLPTVAFADDHKAFFGGLSQIYASTLTGLHLTYEQKTPRPGNLLIVGDFSTQWGTHEGLDLRRTTAMGGVRFAFASRSEAAGPTAQQASGHPRHIGGVHALIGIVNDSDGGDEGTDGALAVGASYAFVARRFASNAALGIRVQADYINRLGDSDGFPRVSVGAVYWFGG